MSFNADLALYDSHGQLAALADIRKRLGTSGKWATALRRNILAHGGFPSVEFFLVVTPDRLYVWKNAGMEPRLVKPTYEVDARPLLEPYFKRIRRDPAEISGEGFELLVGSWLADLTRSGMAPEQVSEPDSWLMQSGFLNAVRNGRVDYQLAA